MIKAIIRTAGLGEMAFRLYPEYAPDTVASFCKDAAEGFYDGLLWFRCQEGYVIQSGSPDNNIDTDSDFHLKGEFRENGVDNPLNNLRGALGLGRDNDPDTAGTQFYVVHQDLPHLDGRYCVFGTMLYGFDVLDAIACRETRGKESWYYPLDPPVIEHILIEMEEGDKLPPLNRLP